VSIADKLHRSVRRLSESLRAEVLAFVEYLLHQVEFEGSAPDRRTWSALSLSLAMRGMEDEETPEYTLGDLKQTF
jgi:hypothetical protein